MAFILDDIFLGPIRFVKWLGEKIKEAAEHEMTDKGAVQEEILELQIRHEMGEIADEEYQAQEDLLMKRLEYIRTYKEEGPKP